MDSTLCVGSSIQQPRFDPVPAAIYVACQTARASCLTAGAAKHTAEASSDAVDATEMDGCDQEPLLEPRAAGGTETTLPQPPREPPAGFTKPLPTSLEPLSRLLELEAGTVADIAGAAAGIAGTALQAADRTAGAASNIAAATDLTDGTVAEPPPVLSKLLRVTDSGLLEPPLTESPKGMRKPGAADGTSGTH